VWAERADVVDGGVHLVTGHERPKSTADLYQALLEREARLESLIEQLLERDRHRDPLIGSVRPSPAANEGGPVRFTAREDQILRLLVVGYTNRQIGARLQLGTGTVRNYLGRIFRKLGATTRTQAAVRAFELGISNPASDPTGGIAGRTEGTEADLRLPC
jgi:DNA-binding NarL/FixJ family response regulator